ncbi:N-substituted formamide deformylase precursor [Legionella massiliensis]|uniref:N-substituted formamide deformylase n=1 Tax=Legionella massiliensis TaxID=1034943 RepID=A0A078KPK0_9GAMM|nr:amidohydrolase [Legionella massiliensis]CDZ76335.1 N-substituted formamide deformylase precursor [Legionella massiliensis]CEE12073.1 N-substituted formamide deformylase precursor [Legionella massiliensis]
MQGSHYKFAFLLCCCIGFFNESYATQPAVTIYVAKKIITMDPIQPEASAVAVKEGKIFSVGTLQEMKTWMKPGSYKVDSHFANHFLTPGLIESHSHLTLLTILMSQPYVGYWDYPGFNGTTIPAAKSKAEILARLKAENKRLTNPKTVLFAWGYDPLSLKDQTLCAEDLDKVSKTRAIFVLHASDQIAYVNSVLLKNLDYNAQSKLTGVLKGPNGQPTGVLKEMAAIGPALKTFYHQLFTEESFRQSLYSLADTAQHLGLTTFSDLMFGGSGEKLMVPILEQAAKDPNFPERMVLVYNGELLYNLETRNAGTGIRHLRHLMALNSTNLNFGHVKFVSDGSIEGLTARLDWPGYINGKSNGVFNATTEALEKKVLPFWEAGFPIHIHSNGDQAITAVLNSLQYLQNFAPRTPTLFTIEHSQMANATQLKLAQDLGAYINLLTNHLYYWGDQYYSFVLGPDRTNRLDNAAEAKRQGLIFSLHSDSPVTPLGPLYSMWTAMNRVTASGRVLNASQRISAEDALRAVTINAAYLLNLQNEIGSIEIGKRADFTVLARDPLTEPSMTIKDIPVLATVQNGRVFTVRG